MGSYGHPVHYLGKKAGNPLKVIACGKRAGIGGWSTDPAKYSCYDCARSAEDLTPQQRDEIWDAANERLSHHKRSPWADVLKAETEGAKKAG